LIKEKTIVEYNFYLEQKYLYAGRVEARILTAAEAEAQGYEDDYVRSTDKCKIFVNGFNSLEAAHSYLDDLTDCTLVG